MIEGLRISGVCSYEMGWPVLFVERRRKSYLGEREVASIPSRTKSQLAVSSFGIQAEWQQTMGTKSKSKSKKGPKGKKARAKAKLEQVWGEQYDAGT